jgi:hypothetical protein
MPPCSPGENVPHLSSPWESVDDWSPLKGQNVEIHSGGRTADRGQVDDVLDDGSLLWLRADGASGRRIIENQPGTSVRISNT